MAEDKRNTEQGNHFAQQAHQKRQNLFLELWEFLRDNKKWWLTPIIIILLLLTLLIILSGSSAAPFIYTLF